MRKYPILVLFFAGILAGTTAFAASSSLVGKKIEREVSIEVDGQKIETEAIVVNGTTYVPVRSVGEMSGYKVTYKGGVVRMQSSGEAMETTPDTNEGKEIPSPAREEDLDSQIKGKRNIMSSNNAEIEKQKAAIENSKKSFEEYAIYKEQGLKFEDSVTYKEAVKYIGELEAKNETLKREIEELERQKAELSGNK